MCVCCACGGVSQVVWVVAGRGRYLGGTFQLQAGERITPPLASDAPAEEVRTVLESHLLLPVASVERHNASRVDLRSGYNWTLRFDNSSGSVQSLPLLTVHSQLHSAPTVYHFDVFVRQRASVRFGVEFMHLNLQPWLLANSTFLQHLNGSLSISVLSPRRAEYGRRATFVAVLFRRSLRSTLLPTNLAQNNTVCNCTVFDTECQRDVRPEWCVAGRFQCACARACSRTHAFSCVCSFCSELGQAGQTVGMVLPYDRFSVSGDSLNGFLEADDVQKFWLDPAASAEPLETPPLRTLEMRVQLRGRAALRDQPNKRMLVERCAPPLCCRAPRAYRRPLPRAHRRPLPRAHRRSLSRAAGTSTLCPCRTCPTSPTAVALGGTCRCSGCSRTRSAGWWTACRTRWRWTRCRACPPSATHSHPPDSST